jgi:uncharacterized protein (TIGR03435 family)
MTGKLRILTVTAAIGLQAQSPLAFDAASIKLHPEPVYASRSDASGTYATWTAETLRDLVVEAYGLKYYQVTGGPHWVESDHFDISARAPGDTAPTHDEFRQMIQTMLADRFQVKAHREMKEIPVYALVVGKNGPKLKDPDMNSREGYAMVDNKDFHIVQSHATMQRLADHLSDSADRPVLDKTGLAGLYAYKLDFSLGNSTTDSDLPAMSTAVEQLGLRLDPQKAPVEILIIDSAEKPSEN